MILHLQESIWIHINLITKMLENKIEAYTA